MADEIERLLVRVEANATQFENQMKKVNKTLWAQQASNRKALDKMRADTAEVGRRLGQDLAASLKTALASGAGAIAGAFSVSAIKNFADGYTRYTNQLKVAGIEGERLVRVQGDLFAIGQKYGIELETLGTLYSRSSSAAKDLGASEAELLRFTTGVSAALKVQGGDASQSAGALMQLSQALGGGIVRAEEFNSIMEGARPIAQAVADGIDRFGGSVSKLRTEVADGKVTSQEFFQGFLKGSKELEAQAEKSTLTIAASFTVLNNALGKYIGEADQSLSATQKMSGAITMLAGNLDTIVPALVTIITLVGARYVGAMVGATAATIAQTVAMNGAAASARLLGPAMMAAFGGPVGIALIAITAAVLAYNAALEGSKKPLQENLDAANDLDKALREYEEAANLSAIATGKDAQAARDAAAEKRKAAVEARDHAKALLEEATAHLMVAKAEAAKAARTDANMGFQAMTGGMPGYNSAVTGVNVQGAQTQVDFLLGEVKKANDRLAAGGRSAGGGRGGGAAASSRGGGRSSRADDSYRGPLPPEVLAAIKEGRYTEAYVRANIDFFNGKRTIPVNVVEVDGGSVVDMSKDIASDPLVVNTGEGIQDSEVGWRAEEIQANEDQMRDTFRRTFGDGVRAALQGDLEGFFMSLADRFSDRLIDNLSDQLFDLMNNYAKQQSGGSNSNWFSTAMSWIGNAFAGGFAGGGDFQGGKWATVGEQGPEAIYAKPGGGVKVLSNGALRSMRSQTQTAPSRGGQTFINFDVRGAVMTTDLLQQMENIGTASMRGGAIMGGAQGAASAARAQARRQTTTIPR